ncbi:hypothetical protein [Halorubrum tropicale]|uniref:Uncharacterized protein n=1 Tax=Halorubrum tropicale TaxID=1765655 RepID=A0A0N0U9B7_9EURY|nr:hypothetical protein [Halorubrum tropicale]KOX93276.1 hypothetical protein AMR74_16685 [Halorubrum tropicale]
MSTTPEWMEVDLRVERDGVDAAEAHYKERLSDVDAAADRHRRLLWKLSRVRQLRAMGDHDE